MYAFFISFQNVCYLVVSTYNVMLSGHGSLEL